MLWLSLSLSTPAAALGTAYVCQQGCGFLDIQTPLDLGYTDIVLMDDEIYAPFVVDSGLSVTVSAPLVFARIGPPAAEGSIVVAGLSSLTLQMPVDGPTVGLSAISVEAGSTLVLESAIHCDEGGAAAFSGAGIRAVGADITVGSTAEVLGCVAILGGGIHAVGSTVQIEGSLRGNVAVGGDGGALWAAGDSTVTLADATFSNNAAGSGGAVAIQQSALAVDAASTFTGNTATLDGGALWLDRVTVDADLEPLIIDSSSATFGAGIFAVDSDLVLLSPSLDDNVADQGGGIYVSGGSLELKGGTFNRNFALYNGGDIAVSSGSLEVSDVVSNQAWAFSQGGSIYAELAPYLAVDGSRFEDSYAGVYGGAMEVLLSSDITLNDNVFERTLAEINGGSIDAFASEGLELNRNVHCSTSAELGGAISVEFGCKGACLISNDRFYNADTRSSGAVHVVSASVEARHLTLIDSIGDAFSGPAGASDSLSVVASIVRGGSGSRTTGGVTFDAVNFDPPRPAATPGITSFPTGALVAPGSDCGEAIDFRIHPDSALALGFTDDQGGVWDLGAYGGPATPDFATHDDDDNGDQWRHDCNDQEFSFGGRQVEVCDDGIDQRCNGPFDDGGPRSTVWTDADSDGFGAPPSFEICSPPSATSTLQDGDCDDGEASIYPGAPESCDGVDQNCNGEIDEGTGFDFALDEDNDGFPGERVDHACTLPQDAERLEGRALDCDDEDPERFPGAVEHVDDGIDQDCDGHDAVSFLAGAGCGCSQGGAPTAPIMVFVGLALISGTRRAR